MQSMHEIRNVQTKIEHVPTVMIVFIQRRVKTRRNTPNTLINSQKSFKFDRKAIYFLESGYEVFHRNQFIIIEEDNDEIKDEQSFITEAIQEINMLMSLTLVVIRNTVDLYENIYIIYVVYYFCMLVINK